MILRGTSLATGQHLSRKHGKQKKSKRLVEHLVCLEDQVVTRWIDFRVPLRYRKHHADGCCRGTVYEVCLTNFDETGCSRVWGKVGRHADGFGHETANEICFA